MHRFLAVLPLLFVANSAYAMEPREERAVYDTVRYSRATVREYPGRLVLANALPGDRIELTGHCDGWVRVRVQPGHVIATPVGWIERGSLTRASQPGGVDGLPSACSTQAGDEDRWRDWVGAINAPFRSLRYVAANGSTGWRRITFGTGVDLAGGCTPSYNYTRSTGADFVDPAQPATGLDLGKVSYRYVTQDGAVALVSAPKVGDDFGQWVFVPSSCLVPKGRPTVYFDEPVVQVANLGALVESPAGSGFYSAASIRAATCWNALISPSQSRFGYWPDPLPQNRPTTCAA